ncbi:hypothetical protein DFH11DRAFT_274412, partial [Phellopilus nigrolimitatus]
MRNTDRSRRPSMMDAFRDLILTTIVSNLKFTWYLSFLCIFDIIMSQSLDVVRGNNHGLFVHLKEIEVLFKDGRPQGRISLKLKADGKEYKSPQFGRNDAVDWKLEDTFPVSSTAEISISVESFYKLIEEISVKAADIGGKESFSVEGSKRLTITLTCIPTKPTDKFVKHIIEEAGRQLGNKKLLLDSLGESSKAIAFLMKLGDGVKDLHPAASAAITVINVLYERCKLQKEVHNNATELVQDLTTFLPFTQELTPSLVAHENTRQTIKEMLVAFEQIVSSIIKYSSQGFLGDMLSDYQEEVESWKNDLRRLKDHYDWCVKAEIWNAAIMGVELMEDQALNRLCYARNAYYSAEGVCLEGTRKELFEQVKCWASSDSKLFWLHGFAGSGKTAVANTVAHMFDNQRLLLGCFFCQSQKDDPDCCDHLKLIPTLAYQLSKWHGPYRREVLSVLHSQDELRLAKDLNRQYDLLIKKPLITLEKFTEFPPKPLIIVIDALDKCGKSVELTEVITKLADAVPWLKVFITSRPCLEIQQVLTQSHTVKCQEVNIHAGVVDMQKAVLDYTNFCARKLPIHYSSSLLEEEEVGILAAKAMKALGCFSWIKSIFKFDADKPDTFAEVRRLLGEHDGSPEAELNDFYASRVHAAHRGDLKALPVIQAILCTLFVALRIRPLPITVLVEFLPSLPEGGYISKSDLKTAICKLCPVLYENSADGAVQVYHPSFLDLIGQELHSPQFWIDPVQFQTNLAIKCLQVMHSGLKFNICQLETSYLPNSAVPDLEDRISRCIPQALQYSCLHWMDYISTSDLDFIENLAVQSLVQRFLCGPSALFWLEALSLMGELKPGIEVLAQCINYFKEHNEIKMACVDLHRFTSAFYEGIRSSTPHLYISALSWVPSDCYTAHQFCPSFSNQHLVLKGKDSVWKDDERTMHTEGTALRTGETVGHLSCVTSVAYSPDGRQIVSGSWDETICIWDAQTGKAVGEPLTGHSDWVRSVAYSPDGRHIVSSSDDNTVCIWDTQTGKAVGKPLPGHSDLVTSVAYSPDGRHIVSGLSEGSICIWDAQTGKAVGEPLTGHSDWVRSVAYSPDGRHIVSGSDDNTVCIWDAQTVK